MMVVALLRIRKHRLSHDIYALRRVALRCVATAEVAQLARLQSLKRQRLQTQRKGPSEKVEKNYNRWQSNPVIPCMI